MKNIKINLKIINADMPYEYNGDAKKDKNIISFEDNNDSYVFDKDNKVLSKSNKNNNIIIDFKNSIITIDDYSFDIDVLEELLLDNEIFYRYKLEDNVIKLVIREVE